jgi:hypothetical protein
LEVAVSAGTDTRARGVGTDFFVAGGGVGRLRSGRVVWDGSGVLADAS